MPPWARDTFRFGTPSHGILEVVLIVVILLYAFTNLYVSARLRDELKKEPSFRDLLNGSRAVQVLFALLCTIFLITFIAITRDLLIPPS